MKIRQAKKVFDRHTRWAMLIAEVLFNRKAHNRKALYRAYCRVDCLQRKGTYLRAYRRLAKCTVTSANAR